MKPQRPSLMAGQWIKVPLFATAWDIWRFFLLVSPVIHSLSSSFAGITWQQYREAVKNGNPLDWVCAPCSQQWTLHSFHADVPSLNSPFQPPVDSTLLSTSFPCNMMDGLLSQLDLPSFHVPDISAESLMDDTQPVADISDGSNDVFYTLISQSSECNRDKLADSLGYSYGVKGWNDMHTIWRCSVCNKKTYCLATVWQEGDNFTHGPHPHHHPAEPGVATTIKTRKKINQQSLANMPVCISNYGSSLGWRCHQRANPWAT